MTAGPRIIVVGASSGLGRTIGIGIGLAGRGARVALLARRKERLDQAAIEAGNGAIAVTCDEGRNSASGRRSLPGDPGLGD
jgi:short-subunit dehydrogenase